MNSTGWAEAISWHTDIHLLGLGYLDIILDYVGYEYRTVLIPTYVAMRGRGIMDLVYRFAVTLHFVSGQQGLYNIWIGWCLSRVAS